ncbi:MAG: lamin tail domain-containing protein, partial [Bacteroidales bacterium]|nr:lamin tail domain-containing protein [Bacteroidales bacterium]
MKKTLFLALVFMLLATFSIKAQDLFFSEYIEGSSNNKALEIYNPTGSDVDLSAYSINKAGNGGDWETAEALSGTLVAGDVFVIVNSAAATEILNVKDIESTITYFNGDDAVGLFKDGTLIDVIGLQGIDPGSGWPVAGIDAATANHTLIRKSTITEGATDWAVSAGTNATDSQWEVKDQDDFSNIGIWGEPAPKVFISEYFEGSGDNRAIEIYNGTGADIDLSAYSVKQSHSGSGWGMRDIDGTITAMTEYVLPLTGTLVAGDVYVIYNSNADAAIVAEGDLALAYGDGCDGCRNTSFTGNDPIGLFYNDELIDAVGAELATDGPWAVAGVDGATEDHTLVRKFVEVTKGNTDWASSAGTTTADSEWIVYSADDFGYIGWHSEILVPIISEVVVSLTAPLSTETVSVTAVITDDGTIATASLKWGLAEGTYDQGTINMTLADGVYTTDTDIPAQADKAMVYFVIEAIDNDNNTGTSSEFSYKVTDPQTTTIPYTETFDADLGNTYAYSAGGATKAWGFYTLSDEGTAYMSGYDSGDLEEDWLVLPAINLDLYNNEIFTFDSYFKYGTDDADNYLKVYYSLDYLGVGDVTTATWTELTFTAPVDEATWAGSGDISLDGIAGTNVYIAFKYNYNSGSYRNWNIDNVSITGDATSTKINLTEASDILIYSVDNKVFVNSDNVNEILNISIYS